MRNKEKAKEYNRLWRSQNKEHRQLYKKEYEKNNPKQKSECGKRYRTKSKVKIAAKRKERDIVNKERKRLYDKEYRSKNKGRLSANKRSGDLIRKNAQPKWLTKFDLDYIKHLYIQAKELEKLDGIKYHVDHIIPLINDIICGMHVPWNLQILTASENMSKKNKIIEEL